jgi:hypothetical protein
MSDETPLAKAVAKLDDVPEQTPIEVIHGVTIRRKKGGRTIMRLHYSAIPERDPATERGALWQKREKSDYPSMALWNREQEIDANATGGEAVFARVLSQFYDIIVISDPHWFPDPRWDVVGAMDHGVTNATAILKAYIPRATIDPATGKKNPPEVILAGEYYSYRRDGWSNTVEQNCAMIMRGGRLKAGSEELVDELDAPVDPMPDLDRARWIVADPSIFYESQVQDKGKPTNVYQTYAKNGFYKMRAYDGNRSDVSFVEWMHSDYWRGIANGRPPRLKIVCRNPSDRPQPGLHPYDCPNLVWEMRRAKRVQMTARQLQTRSQSESLQDKDNHLLDCMKMLSGTIRNPSSIPFEEHLNQELSKVTDPLTQSIRARFLMSEAMLTGKIGLDGKPRKNGKSAPIVDLRRKSLAGR